MNRKLFHHIIYFCSLTTIAIALPLSLFVMTVGITALAINAVLEWNWSAKWKMLKSNRLLLLILSFPVFYAVGFIQTEHINLGINSLLMKLPLLIIPLVIATTEPISKKEIRLILLSYIGSLLFTTIYSTIYLYNTPIQDIREISVFISHIRFSLNIVFGIIILFYFVWKKEWGSKYLTPIYTIILVWFIIYLFISQTLTGIAILLFLTITLLIYILFNKNKTKETRIFSFTILSFISFFFIYIFIITFQYFHEKEIPDLEIKTASGNTYTHDFETVVENGSRIGLFVCEKELRDNWISVSNVPYDSIKYGLIRFLNSKGEKKDREGFQRLSAKEIHNIELGYANVDYSKGIGLKRSLYPTYFSLSLYNKYGKISQSSLLERFELWKATLTVLKKNLIFGVGIGDHKYALDQQLEKQHSEITKKEKGCHNQYLTILLSGGVILLIPFLLMLGAPFMIRKRNHIIYIQFFLIIAISMITEDTLDTHAGVTFFAFFNSILLFMHPFEPKE